MSTKADICAGLLTGGAEFIDKALDFAEQQNSGLNIHTKQKVLKMKGKTKSKDIKENLYRIICQPRRSGGGGGRRTRRAKRASRRTRHAKRQ
jgi:hypothetical protein